MTMKSVKKSWWMGGIFILFFIIFNASPSFAKNYEVLRVIDGDTFVATDGLIEFKVRIVGLDAPESDQDFGKLSKMELQKEIEGKFVSLRPLKHQLDRYNRILAQVFLDQHDIALWMIQKGLAYYYRPTCQDYPVDKKKYDYDPQDYIFAESEAKKLQIGVWATKQQDLPCEYRRKHPYR